MLAAVVTELAGRVEMFGKKFQQFRVVIYEKDRSTIVHGSAPFLLH